MLSVTLTTAGIFADSTTVKAYPLNSVVDKTQAPRQASVAEAATANGAVTLAGLTEGQEYMVGAEVSSKWVYMHITVPTPGAEGFANVASANTITLPAGALIEVTGVTEIKKITAGVAGKRITLLFKEAVKVVKGENLKTVSTFEATALDTMTLVCDGTNWYEVSRAANS